MTDHELKLEIIKKNFIAVGKKYSGRDESELLDDIELLMEEEGFIETMMLCMEEWAGSISARINEEDEN